MKILQAFKDPKLVWAIVAVAGFALSTYAFQGPQVGCTPGTCTKPLSLNFTSQRVGVGTTNPQITLDVAGGVRIGQLTTANINQITCDANKLGTLIFDTDEDLVKVCASGGWAPLE